MEALLPVAECPMNLIDMRGWAVCTYRCKTPCAEDTLGTERSTSTPSRSRDGDDEGTVRRATSDQLEEEEEGAPSLGSGDLATGMLLT